MTKIILYLRDDEIKLLRDAAIRDYRDIANQARFMLREALATIGPINEAEVKQHEQATP